MSKRKRIVKHKLGRPLASPLPRDENVNIRLNSREKECLDLWCWRYDLSASECIRQLMMIHSVIPES